MRIKVKAGRIPAFQTCLDRGWASGTILSSKIWKDARRIGEPIPFGAKNVADKPVRMFVLYPDGQYKKDEYLHSFPEDVFVTSVPVAPL